MSKVTVIPIKRICSLFVLVLVTLAMPVKLAMGEEDQKYEDQLLYKYETALFMTFFTVLSEGDEIREAMTKKGTSLNEFYGIYRHALLDMLSCQAQVVFAMPEVATETLSRRLRAGDDIGTATSANEARIMEMLQNGDISIDQVRTYLGKADAQIEPCQEKLKTALQPYLE